ncbi:hypothetical protein ACK3SF_01055 [Candidatus Nanosalina sp. VS9-1]|uniref:hypothetical protein n=1 Tax=Candidatus Nanosalina sp. VS9-1 TaxID=3388566 RepID=UPI0039E049B5
MSLSDEIRDIESKEESVKDQEGSILSDLFEGGSIDTSQILKNKRKFLNAVEELEMEINEIEAEIEEAEEEVYEREENEFQKLSDISNTETEVENEESALFEDIINMKNSLKNAQSSKALGYNADPDMDSQYGNGRIERDGEFPSDKLLEEVEKFKTDVRRMHTILVNIDDIEEVEIQDSIPAIEMLEEEIGRLRMEEERLENLVGVLEEVEDSDKTGEIHKIESKAKTLKEQLNTLIKQGEALKKRGAEVEDQTLQNVERIQEKIHELKYGNTASLRDVARYFADVQANQDRMGPGAGTLRVRKADEINEAFEDLLEAIHRVDEEAEHVRKEILDAKDFYDDGQDYAADPDRYQSGENIGKAT